MREQVKRLLTAMTALAVLAALSAGVSAGVIFEQAPGILLNQSFGALSAVPAGWEKGTNNVEMVFPSADDYVTAAGNGNWRFYTTDSYTTEGGDYVLELGAARPNQNSMYLYAMTSDTNLKTISGIAQTGYTIAVNTKKGTATRPHYQLWKNSVMLAEYDPEVSYQTGTDVKLIFRLSVTGTKTTLSIINSTTGLPLSIASGLKAVLEVADNEPLYEGKMGFFVSGANARLFSASLKKVYAPVEHSFILDRVFTNADTIPGLKAEGWEPGANARVTQERGLELCYVGHTYSGYGAGKEYFYYDRHSFTGDYTVEAGYYCNVNYGSILVNYVDQNNFYALQYGTIDNVKGISKIVKKVNGTETVLYTGKEQDASITDRSILNLVPHPQRVQVENIGGSVKISVVVRDRDNNVFDEYSYTDTNNPITGGKAGIQFYQNGINNLKSFKAYSGASLPALTGDYYVDGSKEASFVRGATSLDFPVKLLNESYTILAALYSDDRLVSVRTFSTDRFLAGQVSLFDTADVEGSNLNIRTYVWESIGGLTPVTNSFDF